MPRRVTLIVDRLVKDDQQRSELVAFALRGGRTGDDVARWLADRGHKVCRSAVYRWRSRLLGATEAQRLRNLAPDDNERRRALIVQTAETADGERLALLAGFCVCLNLSSRRSF